MVENIAAKAATTETAALSSQGLVMMQKDLLTKSGSSNDSKDNTINDADSALKTLDSGSDEKSRTQFLSSHISKMTERGFDFGKVGKTDSKLSQLAQELDDAQESVSPKDAAQISSRYARQQGQRTQQASKLAMLAESLEASPQQKPAVQRYVQSYFAYLMSDDPKIKDRMKKDEQSLRQSGFKDDTIFSLQKQIKTAARADISARIKENLLMRDLAGNKAESILSQFGVDSKVSWTFNNMKLGGWDFSGVMGDLQTTVNKSMEQNQKEISQFMMQDLEEQMVSKMIKGDKEVSDLNTHISTLMKMGVNVLSWLSEEWSEKKFDLGLLPPSAMPEETTGKQINFNADGQSGGHRGDQQQEQSEGELMIGQLRALYVQRLINGGLMANMRMSFKIRRLKNGLLKMGAFSQELDDKIVFEAEAIAKKKIMDMLEEAMIERAGLFKLKGKAFETHENKVKQLLKAAERLGMRVDEEDLRRIRDSVNGRMVKIVGAQIEVMENIMAKRGKTRKAEKNLGNMKTLYERLTQELNGGAESSADTGEENTSQEKENAYV